MIIVKIAIVLFMISSCCHQEATVIQTRVGYDYPNSHSKTEVYAYQIVVNDTFWVQSADSLGVGDKLEVKR
jgi:hypothetical protein